jgi:hypothetical protein
VFEWYSFCFGNDPQDSYLDGDRGDQKITNNYRFQFRNLTSLAEGADLVIVAQRLCVIEVSPSGAVAAKIL